MRLPGLIFAVAVFFSSPLSGSGKVRLIPSEYNFGAFKEADGPKTGSVKMVNDGSAPTFIRSVRPSCGCTSADFSKDMIAPGDTATISFTYDPALRPGPFDKTVKVYVGDNNEVNTIRITGTVIGSASTLEANYPYESGSLRFSATTQPMGEIRQGSSRHVFINVYNQGNDTVRPSWKSSSKALEADLAPKELAPGEIGTFGFYLNTNHEKRAGVVEYVVSVKPDVSSSKSEVVDIKLPVSIVADSRKMSVEEIEEGPRAYLVPEFIDFGESVGDTALPFELEVLNDGKKDLNIDKVYSSDGEVTIRGFQRRIRGGKTGKIKGVLSAGNIPAGAFRIHLDVITDDPLHPRRTASLVGVRVDQHKK